MNELGKMVIERALAGVESLPPEVRADLYHGVAEILRPHSTKEADAALQLACALREAEQSQLRFNLVMGGAEVAGTPVLKGDFKVSAKRRLVEQHKTVTALAKEMGLARNTVSLAINHPTMLRSVKEQIATRLGLQP